MKRIIILGIITIMLIGIGIAQIGINFPNNFEITIPPLPLQQSEGQIIFNCPYDQNIEYRMVGIKSLTFNQTIPQVVADVKYWTQDRKCAGSKRFNLNLAPVLSSQQLVTAFQNQISLEFIEEAQSNHQPNTINNTYIAGSAGHLGQTAGGSGAGGI